MMGLYFAATGFGNKIAGSIGEVSQLEEYKGDLTASVEEMNMLTDSTTFSYYLDGKEVEQKDHPINLDMNITFKASIYRSNNDVVFEDYDKEGVVLSDIMEFDLLNRSKLIAELIEFGATEENPMHAKLLFEKDAEAAKAIKNKGDGQDYQLSFIMEETQNKQEYNIFKWIVIYTVAFGLLLIVFMKKLNKLSHGAEDEEAAVS